MTNWDSLKKKDSCAAFDEVVSLVWKSLSEPKARVIFIDSSEKNDLLCGSLCLGLVFLFHIQQKC